MSGDELWLRVIYWLKGALGLSDQQFGQLFWIVVLAVIAMCILGTVLAGLNN